MLKRLFVILALLWLLPATASAQMLLTGAGGAGLQQIPMSSTLTFANPAATIATAFYTTTGTTGEDTANGAACVTGSYPAGTLWNAQVAQLPNGTFTNKLGETNNNCVANATSGRLQVMAGSNTWSNPINTGTIITSLSFTYSVRVCSATATYNNGNATCDSTHPSGTGAWTNLDTRLLIDGKPVCKDWWKSSYSTGNGGSNTTVTVSTATNNGTFGCDVTPAMLNANNFGLEIRWKRAGSATNIVLAVGDMSVTASGTTNVLGPNDPLIALNDAMMDANASAMGTQYWLAPSCTYAGMQGYVSNNQQGASNGVDGTISTAWRNNAATSLSWMLFLGDATAQWGGISKSLNGGAIASANATRLNASSPCNGVCTGGGTLFNVLGTGQGNGYDNAFSACSGNTVSITKNVTTDGNPTAQLVASFPNQAEYTGVVTGCSGGNAIPGGSCTTLPCTAGCTVTTGFKPDVIIAFSMQQHPEYTNSPTGHNQWNGESEAFACRQSDDSFKTVGIITQQEQAWNHLWTKSISSATYDSTSGVVTLTLSANIDAASAMSVGDYVYITGMTCSAGSCVGLNGNFLVQTAAAAGQAVVKYQAVSGQGTITINNTTGTIYTMPNGLRRGHIQTWTGSSNSSGDIMRNVGWWVPNAAGGSGNGYAKREYVISGATSTGFTLTCDQTGTNCVANPSDTGDGWGFIAFQLPAGYSCYAGYVTTKTGTGLHQYVSGSDFDSTFSFTPAFAWMIANHSTSSTLNNYSAFTCIDPPPSTGTQSNACTTGTSARGGEGFSNFMMSRFGGRSAGFYEQTEVGTISNEVYWGQNGLREDTDANNGATSGLLAHWTAFSAGEVDITTDTDNINEADVWPVLLIGK